MRKSSLLLFLFSIWLTSFGCSKIELEIVKDEGDIYPVEEVELFSDKDGWDQPANEGIRNALLNAEQLVNLQYIPIQDFNKVGGKIPAGTPIRGLIYSSTRSEDLFCPNNVSLWTFMSALMNPYSYLYSIDVTENPFFIRGYAKAYYGQVCSSFVQYALGIKENIQIHQMTVWPGIDKVHPQDIDKIRLGDILTTEKGHTRLITGIRRENGHVVEIAISEGVSPCAKRSIYPVQDVVETLNSGYVFYRYRYINNTIHYPSPFVAVGDEVSVGMELPSEVLMPRRGDRANWRKDEPVIVDVLSRQGFEDYKLYKDGRLLFEKSIPNSNIIDFGILPYGKYKMCLSEESYESELVSWIVADYSISVQSLGNGTAKVMFSSNNAKPVWVTWRLPSNLDAENNNMPLWTSVISDKDRLNGYTVSTLDSYFKKYGTKYWEIKVAFETEFGIISSDSESIRVK